MEETKKDVPLSYSLVRARRKTISLEITENGELLVRAPQTMSLQSINKFIESKRDWIERARKKQEERMENLENLEPLSPQQVQKLAREACEWIPKRVDYYARQMGVHYGRITIRNQTTRWGSCSGKGNLNFNCLLMLTPEEIRDYVVVHELCHLLEMNHSPRFWQEVERILPDYKQRRSWLKKQGNALIMQMKMGQGRNG